MIFENPRIIIGLSLHHHENYIIPFIPIWIAVTFTLIPKAPLLFLVDNWKIQLIVFFAPFIVLIVYFLIFYFLLFKKIRLFDQKYFFSFPGRDDNDFIKSPALILNENLVSRFSFKLQIFGNEVSKFDKCKRYAIIFEKQRPLKYT